MPRTEVQRPRTRDQRVAGGHPVFDVWSSDEDDDDDFDSLDGFIVPDCVEEEGDEKREQWALVAGRALKRKTMKKQRRMRGYVGDQAGQVRSTAGAVELQVCTEAIQRIGS